MGLLNYFLPTCISGWWFQIFSECAPCYIHPRPLGKWCNLTNAHIIVQMGWWKTTNYIDFRRWVLESVARFHTRVAHSPKMSWIYRSIAGYNVVSLMLGFCRPWPGLQTANGLGPGGLDSWDRLLWKGLLLRRSQTTKQNHQVTIDWFAAFGRNNFSETYFWDCELPFLLTIVQIGEWVSPRQESLKSWSRWWWKSSQYFNKLMNFFLDCYCWKKSFVRSGTYPIVLTSFYVSTGTPNKQF